MKPSWNRSFCDEYKIAIHSTSVSWMFEMPSAYDPIVIPDESRAIDGSVSASAWLIKPCKCNSTGPSHERLDPIRCLYLLIETHRYSVCGKTCIYPPEYEGHFGDLMIKREEIIDRAAVLAQLVRADYQGRRPVLLCVLKGASPVRVKSQRMRMGVAGTARSPTSMSSH